MHKGLIADNAVLKAYNIFHEKIKHPSDLGMTVIPEHLVPQKGKKVSVSLYGVIGFSHVLQKIMRTIDAQLLCSKYAEQELIKRFKRIKSDHKKVVLNRNKQIAIEQIVRLVKCVGFCNPKFNEPETLRLFSDLLISLGIIHQMDYYKHY